MPSALEYFGHMFFFAGFLAGPNHHYNQYKAMIEGLAPASSAALTGAGTQASHPLPRATVAAYSKMVLAFVFMVTSLAPAILYGYSAKMELLADDEFVANVCRPGSAGPA